MNGSWKTTLCFEFAENKKKTRAKQGTQYKQPPFIIK